MRSAQAYADLRRFGRNVITTEEAALRLHATHSAACRTLGRLAQSGLVTSLRRGLWLLAENADPLSLVEHVAAPFPAYVSLHSALYLHGLITQIPRVVYVVSLGPTRRVPTRLATFSLHRVAPEFFGGFRHQPGTGVPLATPEKALVDVLYLTNARSRLFARLPEIELPPRFSELAARRWIARCPAASRRAMMTARLGALLRRAAPS
jgi:predicted transcriptional regulator of viral defense system